MSVYKSDGDKKQTRLLLGPFLFSRSKRDNARFQRDIEIMLGLTETEFFRRFLTLLIIIFSVHSLHLTLCRHLFTLFIACLAFRFFHDASSHRFIYLSLSFACVLVRVCVSICVCLRQRLCLCLYSSLCLCPCLRFLSKRFGCLFILCIDYLFPTIPV